MSTQLAYFAGLFDGEGCVRINKSDRTKYRPNSTPLYNLHLSIANQNLEVLELLKEMFGGSIHFNKHSACYSWVITTQKAASFLRAINPYVIVKRSQVRLALEWVSIIDARSSKKRWLKKSDAEIALYDDFIEAIKDCKKVDKSACHEKADEFMGRPTSAAGDNHEPSSTKGLKVVEKVQRLMGEEPTNKPNTSVRPERDDIVRAIR